MKTKFGIIVLFIGLGVVVLLLGQIGIKKPVRESSEVIQKRIDDHQADVKAMEEQWVVEREAARLEKAGKYDEAITLYLKAAQMRDPNVPRLSLERIYENTGQYEKALEQTEWFLKGNQNEQGRQQTLLKKAELIKKIEAQKNSN